MFFVGAIQLGGLIGTQMTRPGWESGKLVLYTKQTAHL